MRGAFVIVMAAGSAVGCTPSRPAAMGSAPAASTPVVTAEGAPAALGEGVAPTTAIPAKTVGDDFVRPCAPDDPRMAAARAAFDGLRDGIDALDPLADPKPMIATMKKVMEEPCFVAASSDYPSEVDEADSGWALKDWWDRGGDGWLKHYLELADPDVAWRGPTFPPSPRPALTREHHPQHPLKHLLCGVADQACHEAHPAFRLRAELHFEAEAKADEGDAYCTDEAKAEPLEKRYAAYYYCYLGNAGRQRMLPLGGMRLPTDGWLVLEGSRPNHHDCPEIRAFDLKAGAYYVLRTCSPERKRLIGPEADPVVGKIPVAAVREAAWMTLLANEVSKPGLAQGFSTTLPDADEVEIPMGWDDSFGFGGLGMAGIGSSASNDWHWHYLRAGKRVTGGRLDDPTLHSGTIHARNLLRVAELQHEAPGCAPTRLPKLVLDTSSSEDKDEIARRERVQADAAAIATGLRVRRCR